MTIRVVIADDQSLIRLGLSVLASGEEDIEIVGEADNGREALDQVRRLRPDVLLLDIRMPIMDGLEVLRHMADDPNYSETRVIVMTTFDIDEYVFAALDGGAAGFLTKDTDPGGILHAIRVVANGDALLSPGVTRRVISRFTRGAAPAGAPHPDLERLTAREREIVGWVATGRSNDEIAEKLVVSPATVRTHVGRAMAKLGARDRAQLVVIAYRSGIPIPD
ncbi:response regulator [Stackebrandtia soli]|uniref:response regulator n=1 Tax=Stackebrandtia soli TaxID=1892856 RepID=UPI0039EACD36